MDGLREVLDDLGSGFATVEERLHAFVRPGESRDTLMVVPGDKQPAKKEVEQ